MQAQNISILYIDDNKKQTELLCSVATEVCSELHIADNTTDGLKLYQSHNIDIVIVSLEMQQRVKSNICTLIKNKNKDQILICLVTDNDNKLFFEAIKLEVDYYIALPLEIQKAKNTLIKASQELEYKKSFVKLQESEEKFRQMSQTSQMGIFIYRDRYIYANDAFCRITGYTKEELYSMHAWDIMQEDDKELIEKICVKRLQGEKFPKVYRDLDIVTKSGEIKINRITTDTIKYDNGFAGFGTAVDITDIKAAKERLKLLAQAVEQMDEMVRITDIDGKIIYVNKALSKHTLYKKSELIGKSNTIFKSEQHTKEFYKNMWNTILSNKPYNGIFVNKKKSGELYYEEQTITPITGKKNKIKYFVSTSKDVSVRIAMEKELKYLATTDALTGIYNRYKINMYIEEELSRANRYDETFALIMFDIDFFKHVNDEYGHDIGDYVLIELSRIVLDSIRESDRLGRWGGEEFMILAPNIDENDAISLAEKLRQRVQNHSFKHIKGLTISLGVTTSKHKNEKEEMLKSVDNALYEAKDRGRNRVIFHKCSCGETC